MVKKSKKSLLNPTDIDNLIGAMKVVFPTREEVEKIVEEKLNDKIRFIPTKEDFFSSMDTLMGEVKAMREESTLHQGQHREINDRLDKLEQLTQTA